MKTIVLISSLLLSTVMAEELVEPVQDQSSAVSKVMERFSKLSTIESTPIEDVIEEKAVDTTSVSKGENLEKLELVQTIQTAKFESKEMPYPEDKAVIKEPVKKVETKKTEVVEEKSLREIEAHARKVIEQKIIRNPLP